MYLFINSIEVAKDKNSENISIKLWMHYKLFNLQLRKPFNINL